jgi:hypothetical protein
VRQNQSEKKNQRRHEKVEKEEKQNNIDQGRLPSVKDRRLLPLSRPLSLPPPNPLSPPRPGKMCQNGKNEDGFKGAIAQHRRETTTNFSSRMKFVFSMQEL